MGSFSVWHWLIVLVIVMLVFGTKKLRNMGEDLGGAVKGFRDGMKEAEAEVWATDCPLAALQFQQHAGRKPMHPMSILARAYREDGFEKKVEAPAAAPGKKDGERR